MRPIPTLKISISGVRGVIGESLTPNLLTRFAQAFGTYVGARTIVIGRDPRTSGEMVKQAVIAGLLSSGCRILDIGMCPVPTVQLLVRHHDAHGGIAITASHNPAEWNALKFIGHGGFFLNQGEARELLDIYHQGEYRRVGGAEMREVAEVSGASDLHIQAIMQSLGPLPTRGKKLRVVLDACNGAGSIVGPRLLEALGAEVLTINVTPNGSFPRPAEPLPENLVDLCAAVKAQRADIGFAQDMDADRLAIVSEEGAAIGGEGNGGVIYPRLNFARDSLVGMALVLHLLAETGQTITELVNSLPQFAMIKEKLVCPSDKISAVLRMLRREYATFPMDLRDGVKVSLPNGWFLVRGSNTEPIIRVISEAELEADARTIIDRVYSQVQECL